MDKRRGSGETKKAHEGTVTVEKGAEKEKVIDKNIGEYIDFEEEK